MGPIEITRENFREAVTSSDVVVVHLKADWIPECRSFAPIYETVAQRHPTITFGVIDADAEAELAAMFAFTSLPTVVIARELVVTFLRPGALSDAQFEAEITSVLALDMAQVHLQLLAQEISPDLSRGAA